MATTKTTASVKKPETVAPKSAPAKAAPAPASKKKPTTEEIAKKAYEIYLRRGGTHGSDQDDWLQAEIEILSGK